MKLRSNVFTSKEVPLSEPLSWDAFSTGEELSLRQVEAVEWSPPGLAKHRRCALAVLTANHILSIWECTGSVTDTSGWKRSVIVNHFLRNHFSQTAVNGISQSASEVLESAQKAQRVTAFAWSSPLKSVSQSADGSGEHLTWGGHYLAVATGSSKFLILGVEKELRLHTPAEWKFTTETSFDLWQDAKDTMKEAPLLAAMPAHFKPRLPVVETVAWSSWKITDDGRYYSLLAFILSRKLYIRSIYGLQKNNCTSLQLGKQTQTGLGPILTAHGNFAQSL
jgi:hypothetical protein